MRRLLCTSLFINESFNYVSFIAIRYDRETSRIVQQSSYWERIFHSYTWEVHTAVMYVRRSVNDDIGLFEWSISRIDCFMQPDSYLNTGYWGFICFGVQSQWVSLVSHVFSLSYYCHMNFFSSVVQWQEHRQIESNEKENTYMTTWFNTNTPRLISRWVLLPQTILEQLRTLHTDLFHFIYFPSMNDKHIERFDWTASTTIGQSRPFHR
jgi:hypothetical protein